MLEYLQHFQNRPVSAFSPCKLKAFSSPFATDGYRDDCITHDLITDIYLEYSEQTRKSESNEYLKTLKGEFVWRCGWKDAYRESAKTLSLDNTFRAASKATVVDKQKKRVNLMKGGLLGIINEESETISWVRCDAACNQRNTQEMNVISV
jgi:hypothetical protein